MAISPSGARKIGPVGGANGGVGGMVGGAGGNLGGVGGEFGGAGGVNGGVDATNGGAGRNIGGVRGANEGASENHGGVGGSTGGVDGVNGPVDGGAGLFPDEVERDAAGVRVRPVFPEINPLPCPQRQLSAMQRDGEVHRGQRGPDMRGHVVVPLGGVHKQRVAVWHESLKKSVEITTHVGVGIFLDEQRSGGVSQMQGHEAVAEFVLTKPLHD